MLSVLSLMGSSIELPDDSCGQSPTGHERTLQQDHEDDDLNDSDPLGMTKAEIRKSNKPIMEKRRRARINTCLNELKSLILDALKKDPSRHSKLEKADILEMTVKHLQAVQRQQLALAVAQDPSVLEKFKGGFTECAQEISRYISRIDGVDGGIRQRLHQHLSHCTGSLNATTPLSFTAMAGLPFSLGSAPTLPPPPPHGDVNNNQARFLHRLVAARLAAAGDTTGAALLLQGGLSLLARGGLTGSHPPPSVSSTAPPPLGHIPPQPHPSNHSKSIPRVVNEGASSSRISSPRVSAFTAVKRCLSPPPSGGIGSQVKSQCPPLPRIQRILTPRAIRPLPHQEIPAKTLVQAQVALKPLKPVITPVVEEIPPPLDFSIRRTCDSKRPLDEPQLFQRPAKLLKVESLPTSASSSAILSPPRCPNTQDDSPETADSLSRVLKESPSAKDLERKDLGNPEEDEKDMWRPW